MTAGSRGYECRLGMTGTPGWPGGLSYRARRDIYGRINPWIAAIALVVIAVAGGVIPTLVLHGSTPHARKPPVTTSTTGTSPGGKTHGGHIHGTAKLSVALSVSPAQIHTQPDINEVLLRQSGAPALNTYNVTSKPDTAV